jgi:hypothetical protein
LEENHPRNIILNLDEWLFSSTSKCENTKEDRQRATYAERHMMGKVRMIFDCGELKGIECEDA